METVVCVIQARMGSSRLPGKALAELAGVPALMHVLNRARQIQGIDNIILATTTGPQDDALEDWASSQRLAVSRGSERNVVERLLAANDVFDGTHIARVTADCPLIDPFVCSEVVSATLSEGADFGSNYCPPTYPDGLDFSVTVAQKLREACIRGLSEYDLEHVTTVFERNPTMYRTVNILSTEDLSTHRWTLDNQEDLNFLRAVFEKIRDQKSKSDHRSILQILAQNPEISDLQSNSKRNYGHNAKTVSSP